MQEKIIDVKFLIKKQLKRLAFLLYPLLPYLKKILHEDEINAIVRKYNHLKETAFNNAIVEEFNIKIEIKGSTNLPCNGRFLFVANHPLGGLDGIAFMKVISKHYKNIRILANDFLRSVPNFGSLFIPINKKGKRRKQSRETVNLLDEAFASENQILYFPAGLVSRKIKGEVMDLKWNKSFVAKAIKYKRDIIPVYIEGKNSNRFYRISKWRKWLMIPFNIEMIYLPDEFFRQQNAKLTFTIGKPISYKELTKEKSWTQWAQEIKRITYDLKQKNNP